MGNVLEFYLKMKDMMSSGLVKVAQTAKQSFSKVQNYISAGIDKGSKSALTSLDKIQNKLKEVDKTASNTSLFKGGLLSRYGPTALLAGAMAFGTTSVKSAINYGATTKSFEVLTGSKQKGGDLANNLNRLQQDTILGPEVFKAAQTMMSFGIATDKVVEIEKQLGDVSMGNKDKFEALTLAFSQTQAAGRLMGQDLLQYINAGFNPLQVMSERWKEFGLTQKTSVGELKKMMEKGQISAAAVAKSFALATSEGGKFNGMMDAVAKTSYGKMQILEGQWENLKIQAGNALMPIANDLMNVAAKTVDWFDITRQGSEVLRIEQSDLNATVKMVTNLNEGNTIRKSLLKDLVASYPDLFKNIDIEKVKNSELLQTLNDINKSYQDRIKFSQNGEMISLYKKEANESQETIKRWLKMKQLANGDISDQNLAMNMRTTGEKLSFVSLNDIRQYDAEGNLQKSMQYYDKKISGWQQKGAMQELTNTIRDAFELAQSGDKMTSFFGTTKAGLAKRSEFQKLASQIDFSNGKYYTHGGGLEYSNKLRQILTPSIATKKTDKSSADASNLINGGFNNSIAKGVTSGGPRVINVHINKMVETIQINNKGSVKESAHEIETQVKEVFLRVINSGASVQ